MNAPRPTPNTFANQHACAILIVGAGPAGLSAALAAAPSGRSIVVLDDNPAPGGQVWRHGAGAAPPGPLQQLQEALARYPHVRMRCGTRVVAAHGSHALLLESADSAWVQGFEQLILCTGARELLLPFPGWTLPGVTGAGGLQALIKSGRAGTARGRAKQLGPSGVVWRGLAALAEQVNTGGDPGAPGLPMQQLCAGGAGRGKSAKRSASPRRANRATGLRTPGRGLWPSAQCRTRPPARLRHAPQRTRGLGPASGRRANHQRATYLWRRGMHRRWWR